MFGNKMQCGCCQDPGPPCFGGVGFTLRGCPGLGGFSSRSGITVTATDPDGNPTPVGGSFFSYSAGNGRPDGTYTFTITADGYYPRVVTGSKTCDGNTDIGIIYLRPTSIKVRASTLCGGVGDLTVALGGSLSGSHTFAHGDFPVADIPVPDVPGTADPGPYTVTATLERYVGRTLTFSTVGTGGGPWTCSPSIYLDQIEDCYTCCSGNGQGQHADYPITNDLILTTPWGEEITLSRTLGGGGSASGSIPGVLGLPPGGPYDFGCAKPYETLNLPIQIQWACLDFQFGTPGGFQAPQVTLYAPFCVLGYPTGSADTRNGFLSFATIVFSSVNYGTASGGFSATGSITPTPGDVDDPRIYAQGAYHVAEAACSPPPMMMMSFRVPPSAPTTILDDSGRVLGHAAADDAGRVEFRLPSGAEPTWLVAGDDDPAPIVTPEESP